MNSSACSVATYSDAILVAGVVGVLLELEDAVSVRPGGARRLIGGLADNADADVDLLDARLYLLHLRHERADLPVHCLREGNRLGGGSRRGSRR